MNPKRTRSTIRVAVRITEPLLRTGACAALQGEPGFMLVDDDAAVPAGRPDVLVIDGPALPQLLEAVTEPDGAARTPILVVAASARNQAIRSAFRHGIRGVILSTATVEDFIGAVRHVAGGEAYLCHALARQMSEIDTGTTLTAREDDVLQLLVLGKCNKTIARSLHIAPETVKFHVRSIIIKLKVANRTEAASVAIASGMTEHSGLCLPRTAKPPRARARQAA
jgi:DNA-binding NarL/FixJ family response regulator